ncbi:ParA family protein [Alteromonas pelagimontana]|uniref:ParA family protein n=1 Tax=Alteromonas pelagimontana TaxID=1858656 RepID=A0A6M4MEN5_9ALTE|nr:ParA family protein [Alteromonas pelagimontana]QJR81562.1 ParA family protein [Alteromonas pelagimontana]
MKRVVFNQKGGVGKSTISANLAAQSAKQGYRTLLVDLDAQGNSTHYVGVDIVEDTLTVADMFKQIVGWFSKPMPPEAFVQPTAIENLSVLPAHPSLADIERELESRYKMFKLKETLGAMEGRFDRVYIDTPPNFNFYSKAALIAADSFIIPFDCDGFSVQAIERLLENVMELKTDHNPELALEGIVINQFNPQANLPFQLIAELEAKSLPVFTNRLSATVKVKESHSHRLPLPYYAPSHKISKQFAALLNEIEKLPQHNSEATDTASEITASWQ